uniref:Laminin, gamma 2 n=1 Tax=Gasterosteus aculeatus aculeatus TaxID=481459 RepID=G3NA51_GASAC
VKDQWSCCILDELQRLNATGRCDCNGRSQYCLRDAGGLHCVNCQGNTAGRHCERCKDGFNLVGAALSCTPCRCNPAGSVGVTCDRTGRCSCKDGVTGEKCDRCPDGPVGPNGCSQSQMCFCYGHSSKCSPQSGYSIHSITSTFAEGLDGWWVATARGVIPDDVHFRWSPKHHDLEVISKNSLPVYLYAPAPYLGNQLLSYGQNFSFSLRLDRGVRHPSTSDVVLEGGGLRVAASLGDLRSLVPCGQKINYSFRLDEQPGSRWKPQLSASQFQTLLQNLTAVKIRATFGENGRGYLANVRLVTAQRADGAPARWVQTCSCPPGYDGEFCERCSPGFRRRNPAEGAFSRCEPCSCRGGGCDPQTGDCYSADETPGERGCPEGFYRDPWQPGACVRCPCMEGVSCSLPAGSLVARCDRCPTGTTGPRCNTCMEGFYGAPPRGDVEQQTCRPCQCNGHIDVGVAGSCDRSSGECLRCLNNTRGSGCQDCVPGFYHQRATDACKRNASCDCDLQGSESRQCDDSGRCRCRTGYEGLRCLRSDCPACFSPIRTKAYAGKLKQLELLLSDKDAAGLNPDSRDQMEATLRGIEELVDDLQYDTELLEGLEKSLQSRLSSISRSQLADGRLLQNIGAAAGKVERQQQTYKTKVEEVRSLMKEMKRKLDEAKADLRSAEIPLGDALQGSDVFSSLKEMAISLADKHTATADEVQRSANEALSNSERSLALVRTLMNKENKVKELIGDLQTTYDKNSAQVKGLENQATRLSGEAADESNMANGMLKEIANMERNLPLPLNVRPRFVFLSLETFNKLLDRVNVAKTDTEEALRRINGNTKELDDALSTLRGFDQQIEDSRSLADTAIKRLPGINATVQQAVRNNADTDAVLRDVSKDFDEALGTISVLGDLVTGLEGTFGSLPPLTGLMNEATKLNKDSQDLKKKASNTAGLVESQLNEGRMLEAGAQEVRFKFIPYKLFPVMENDLDSNQTGAVDETQLERLEKSVADARNDVDSRLGPRLRDMEEQEEAQRRRLSGINLDIDAILVDIENLEDILKAVPKGCFNSPPIEEA